LQTRSPFGLKLHLKARFALSSISIHSTRDPEVLPVPHDSIHIHSTKIRSHLETLPIFAAMHPTTEEELELTTVPLLRAWAGISDELFTRIATPLGGQPQFIRQIALIAYKVWNSAMHNIPRETPSRRSRPTIFRPNSIRVGVYTFFPPSISHIVLTTTRRRRQ
jgi:hypothetical protein